MNNLKTTFLVITDLTQHMQQEVKSYTNDLEREITERKKAEEALARQAELIDLSPNAIIVRKLNGRITFWSKGAEKLYGWTKERSHRTKYSSLLKTACPTPIEELVTSLNRRANGQVKLFIQRKDGEKLVVQSYWLGKIGEDGKIVEMLESNVDITERIELQLSLKNLPFELKNTRIRWRSLQIKEQSS